MRKFIQPVSMFIPDYLNWCDLANRMIQLGYSSFQSVNDTGFPWIMYTYPSREENRFMIVGRSYMWNDPDVIKIDTYNTELFLALAAMSEGDEMFPGEWVMPRDDRKGEYGERYQFIKVSEARIRNFIPCDRNASLLCENFRKATAEEIIAHFTEKKDSDNSPLDGPPPVIGEHYIHYGEGEYRGEIFTCTNTKGEFSRFESPSTGHTVLCYNNGWAKTFISANPKDKATEFADKMKLSKAVEEWVPQVDEEIWVWNQGDTKRKKQRFGFFSTNNKVMTYESSTSMDEKNFWGSVVCKKFDHFAKIDAPVRVPIEYAKNLIALERGVPAELIQIDQ